MKVVGRGFYWTSTFIRIFMCSSSICSTVIVVVLGPVFGSFS